MLKVVWLAAFMLAFASLVSGATLIVILALRVEQAAPLRRRQATNNRRLQMQWKAVPREWSVGAHAPNLHFMDEWPPGDKISVGIHLVTPSKGPGVMINAIDDDEMYYVTIDDLCRDLEASIKPEHCSDWRDLRYPVTSVKFFAGKN